MVGTPVARAHVLAKRFRLSWWDGMVVAAAELQNCDTPLSEDLQDGMRFGQVTFRNPFNLDDELEKRLIPWCGF